MTSTPDPAGRPVVPVIDDDDDDDLDELDELDFDGPGTPPDGAIPTTGRSGWPRSPSSATAEC